MAEVFTVAEVESYYAARLPALRRRGPEWRGRCPVHGGERDSFSVSAETGFAQCFSECGRGWDIPALERALGNSSFPDAMREVERLTGRNGKPPERRIVAEYEYRDESGEPLYSVVRFEPKDFRQRRPDGSWGIKGVRRVLYRLPEVLASPSVIIVEGEKDADLLAAWGLPATTSPMGAGSWRDEYADALVGKSVVIIPDQDEPGRAHAVAVAKSLLGKARAVRYAHPAKGKDVGEWIDAGGAKGDLLAVIRAAPPLTTETVERCAPGWIERVPTLAAINWEPVEWLIEDLIPRRSVALFAGAPGSYKSTLALDIARCVATSRGFAAFIPGPLVETLYLDRENPRNLIAQRKQWLGLEVAPPRLRYWGDWRGSVDGLERLELNSPMLLQYAAEAEPLIILDSLTRFHRCDENKNSEMRQPMQHIRDLASAGATVLILHHKGKGENMYRGAEEIEAAVDVAYAVERDPEIQRAVKINCFKNRFAFERRFTLTLEGGYGFRGGPTEAWAGE